MKRVLNYFRYKYYIFKRNNNLKDFSGELVKKILVKTTEISIVLNRKNGIVDEEIYLKGVFDKEVLDCILENTNSNSIFLDIGANIGYMSFCVSPFVKKVYSFEPNPNLEKQFYKTIQLNAFNNITRLPYGCSIAESIEKLYLNKSNIGASSILSQNKNEQFLEIQLKPLDSFFEQFEKVDFIKIDVEGYEKFVIDGAEKIIEKYKPKMVIEFSPMYYERIEKGSTQKFYQKMVNYGYKIENLTTKKPVKSLDDIDYKAIVNLYFY